MNWLFKKIFCKCRPEEAITVDAAAEKLHKAIDEAEKEKRNWFNNEFFKAQQPPPGGKKECMM